jgi:hypothetical protein
MKPLTYPAAFNGPKGESAIFESADDVPNGWTSGAEKQSAKGKAAPAASPAAPSAPVDKAELDAHGHAYDSKLHAGTGSKTKAGLWRMKVGVSRPDPAPGFPKPPLDL